MASPPPPLVLVIRSADRLSAAWAARCLL